MGTATAAKTVAATAASAATMGTAAVTTAVIADASFSACLREAANCRQTSALEIASQ